MKSPDSFPFSLKSMLGKHVHLVGIGGCGMSGLARLLRNLGCNVQGTDAIPSITTEALIDDGFDVAMQQDGSMLSNGIDLVVYSAAIPRSHIELRRAEELDIPLVSYAHMLGVVQSQYTGVCIAGTHGKSTTVSMLSSILLMNEMDPSFIVGATCQQIGGSSRIGSNEIPSGPHKGKPGVLVSESCEFNRSFHNHHPKIGLIHNIEEDHLDYYKSLDDIIESFRGFAMRIPSSEQDGFLLIAHEGAHRNIVTAGLNCRIETIGFHPESDYQVFYDPSVCRVGLLRDGMWIIQWTNKMPGSHNALNAAAAAIIAANIGVDWEDIPRALESFDGVDRRLQKVGNISCTQKGCAVVYDDYGHHPTEIEITLKALRSAELPNRLICVFQPHQHSRTRFLLDQFALSFSSADEVIVPHIYFVRDSEVEQHQVSAQDLVEKLIEQGVSAKHIDDFDEIVTHLRNSARDGDVIVIMGAGPVTSIAHDLVQQIELPSER